MKTFWIIVTCSLYIFLSLSSIFSTERSVFICNGNYSKKYHYTKTCRGLSNCSTAIEKVTLDVAIQKKRTLCGWED